MCSADGYDAGGDFATAGVSNIENFYIRDIGAADTTDFSTIVGEEQVWNDRSTSNVIFNDLGTDAVLGIKGDGNTQLGTTTFSMETATDAVNILIDGGVKGGSAITNTSNGPTAATLTSKGGSNVVGAVQLSGGNTVDAATVDAQSNLMTGNITGFAADATLTVTGSGSASLGTQATNVDTVDASGNSGGVTLTLDAEANTKFTGGSGDDMVTTGAAYVAADTASIDAGEGSADRLVVNTSANITAAAGAKYSNFEELQVGDSASVNLDQLAANNSIDSIRLEADNSVVVGATNLTAEQAGNITLFAGATTGVATNVTTGVKGATTVGQLDTVSITASGDDAAVTADNIVADGVETLNLTADTGSATTTINALGHQDWTALNIDGGSDVSITSAAGAANVNSKVDGSSATGDLTLNFSASTTNGINIQGGSGNDTITGGGSDDILTGNAGNDEFNLAAAGTAGVDTVTDFASGDTVAFAAADTTAGTTSGADAVFASEDTALVTGGGAFALDSDTATNDVIELTTTLDDDVTLSASSTGADLLQALSSDGTAASGITVGAANDASMLAVYQNGNAYLFNIAEGNSDTEAVAGDITLAGVFNDVEAGSFASGDFTIA